MVNTDSIPSYVKARIEQHFYSKYGHQMNGHAWFADRLQIKLKFGSPFPPEYYYEGVPIEYKYEEAFALSSLNVMAEPYGQSYKQMNLSHSAYMRWNETDYDAQLLQFVNSLPPDAAAIEGGTTTENVPCRRCYHEFIRGGISTGTTRTGGGSGTLGGIAWRATDAVPVMVSNYHVWCIANFKLGDRVSQPSRSDATGTGSDYVHIGKLARYAPVKIRTVAVTPQPIDNYVDCAYATFLSLSTQKRDARVIDLGLPAGWASATKGMSVAKSGRTTQTTFGIVQAIDVKIKVNNYQMPSGGRGFAYFGGLVQMSEMVHGGDSGSFLFNHDNNGVVGLVMGGGIGESSYACDIVRVASALGLKGKRPTVSSPSIDIPINGGMEINPILAGLAAGGVAGLML